MKGAVTPTEQPVFYRIVPDEPAEVLISKGEYIMGNKDGEPNEGPEHLVYLKRFLDNNNRDNK